VGTFADVHPREGPGHVPDGTAAVGPAAAGEPAAQIPVVAKRLYEALIQLNPTLSQPLPPVVHGADPGGRGGVLAGVLGQQLPHPRQMGP
jgi:hypothetical protein